MENGVVRLFKIAADYGKRHFPEVTQELKNVGHNIADLVNEMLYATSPILSQEEKVQVIEQRKVLVSKFIMELEKQLNAFSTQEQRKAVEYLLPFLRGAKAAKLADATTDTGKFAASDIGEVFGTKLASSKPAKLSQKAKPIDLEKALANVDDSLKVKMKGLLELDNELLKDFRDGARVRGHFQLHHMATKEHRAIREHELWKLSGMNIEDATNKILLPKSKEFHPTRSVHNGAHTEANRERLLKKMEDITNDGKTNDWSKEQYLKGLQEFLLEERHGLINGEIDLYMNPKAKRK